MNTTIHIILAALAELVVVAILITLATARRTSPSIRVVTRSRAADSADAETRGQPLGFDTFAIPVDVGDSGHCDAAPDAGASGGCDAS